MRDREVIDGYLRLLAAVRRAAVETGGPVPAMAWFDQLLDERNARNPESVGRAGLEPATSGL